MFTTSNRRLIVDTISGGAETSPSVAISLRVSNVRFSKFNLDRTKEPTKVSGIFSFDVTNTGLVNTPAASVGDVDIKLSAEDETYQLIQFKKPKDIGSLKAGDTKTVDLEFEHEDNFFNNVQEGVCDKQSVYADMNFSVYEFLLGVEYENARDIPVSQPNCTRFTLSIQSPDGRLEVGSEYTWSADGQNIDEADEIRWDMGDGTSKTGTSVTHSYSERGDYTITATLYFKGESVVFATKEADVILFVIPSF